MNDKPCCTGFQTEPESTVLCYSEKDQLHTGLYKHKNSFKDAEYHLLTKGKTSAAVAYPVLGSLLQELGTAGEKSKMCDEKCSKRDLWRNVERWGIAYSTEY